MGDHLRVFPCTRHRGGPQRDGPRMGERRPGHCLVGGFRSGSRRDDLHLGSHPEMGTLIIRQFHLDRATEEPARLQIERLTSATNAKNPRRSEGRSHGGKPCPATTPQPFASTGRLPDDDCQPDRKCRLPVRWTWSEPPIRVPFEDQPAELPTGTTPTEVELLQRPGRDPDVSPAGSVDGFATLPVADPPVGCVALHRADTTTVGPTGTV